MKRLISLVVAVCLALLGLYVFNQYWIHRYDSLITHHSQISHLDPDLVWSIIYEETYFSPWKIGGEGEIGLMQITPTVGREWASETGNQGVERQMAASPRDVLRHPATNIQVGCWYLEKLSRDFRSMEGGEARVLASYNAGRSRVLDWNKALNRNDTLTEEQFIARIDIPSTRAYVTSILARYRKLKARKSAGVNLQRSDILGHSQ